MQEENKNIFIHLKENKKHVEDYFTKVLTFFLKNNRQFKEKFVTDSLKIKDMGINGDISVEYNLAYLPEMKKPDITISNKDTLILIEIKIASKQGENQLINYSKIIKDKLKNGEIKKGFVVFIPKYFEQVSNEDKSNIKLNTKNDLIELNWSDIYKFFNEDKILTNNIGWLKNQYIELMEVENMQPFRTMNKKNLDIMGKEFSNIIRLLSELKRRLHNKDVETDSVKFDDENLFLEMEIKGEKDCFNLIIQFDIGEPNFYLVIDEDSKKIGKIIDKIKNNIIPNGTFEGEEGKYNPYFIYGDKESKLFSPEITEEQQINELVQFYTNAIEIIKKAIEF